MIKKLLTAILATTSVVSMSLISPASATLESFRNLNFDNLTELSINPEINTSLIEQLTDLKNKIINTYNISDDNIDETSYKSLKDYCTNDGLLKTLSETIDKNTNLSPKEKNLFKNYAKNIFAAATFKVNKKLSIPFKLIRPTDNVSLDTIKAKLKDKYYLFERMTNNRAKLSNKEKQILKNLGATKLINDYLISQQEDPNKKIPKTFIDSSKIVQFLIDSVQHFLNEKKILKWSDYCISDEDYNKIMDDQFKEASKHLPKDLKDTISTNENLTLPTIKDSPTNIKELKIRENTFRHIFVGSKKSNQSKDLPLGHTKYTRNGMEIIAQKRYEKLKNFAKTNSMVDLYEASTNFEPTAFVEKEETITDSDAKSIKYLPIDKLPVLDKGQFPDNWEWEDMRKAISSVLKPSNCKHTTVKSKCVNGKSEPTYRYATFHGIYEYNENKSTKKIPIQVVINVDEQDIVTAFPISEQKFNEQKIKYKKDSKLKYKEFSQSNN